MSNPPIYDVFYNSLKELRELFHASGRFDDSNAKLDEIVKLLSIHIAEFYRKLPRESLTLNRLIAKSQKDATYVLVPELKKRFKEVARFPEYVNRDGHSIFGNEPQLNLHDSDNGFALALIKLVASSLNCCLFADDTFETFDLLNEAFGHFVRDNFRNNIEDAQYMTPPEVVNYMSRMAVAQVQSLKKKPLELVVLDPSCGVGSFLANFYRLSKHNEALQKTPVKLYGQDKVDRMVRLAKINILLFGAINAEITQGNSLLGKSLLDDIEGKVDVILTNPPFGARFSPEQVLTEGRKRYPFFYQVATKSASGLDSECLFMDRYMSLLKPGGSLFAVVPDGVISAGGINGLLRMHMQNNYSLHSVTELPGVTFAQAGTRTKTSIVHIIKSPPIKTARIFMARCAELGFEVSTRKGASVKVPTGSNDLVKILEAYTDRLKSKSDDDFYIIKQKPSCVMVSSGVIENQQWTPSHYSSDRLDALTSLRGKGIEFELIKLKDLVEFAKSKRENLSNATTQCISVLHLGHFGSLNVQEIEEYCPKYPGIPCEVGQVLFSKINPRIPRCVVVPDLGCSLTCSSEFAVMTPKKGISGYAIMMLLLSGPVQNQIKALTSGTSSSHNRIKTEQLGSVLIPLPRKGTSTQEQFDKLVQEFGSAVSQTHSSAIKITRAASTLKGLLEAAVK